MSGRAVIPPLMTPVTLLLSSRKLMSVTLKLSTVPSNRPWSSLLKPILSIPGPKWLMVDIARTEGSAISAWILMLWMKSL